MQIKICGIRTPEIVETCLSAGADFLGFNHIEKSPRYLSLEEARTLCELVATRAQSVLLLVNPGDALIDQVSQIVAPDWIQLHGSETPERIAQVSARMPAKIFKAISVNTKSDLADIDAYHAVSDGLLLDAKPAPGDILPGGNGGTFDWDILSGDQQLPDFFLAGGLNPETVGKAVVQVRPFGVDVASGVEISRGVKDAQMIEQFIAQARAAERAET